MLWAPGAIEAWDDLFRPDQPLRRLFLAAGLLDLIETEPDRLWDEAVEGLDAPDEVQVVRSAVEGASPTLWIFWTREDGQPIVLDFRVESTNAQRRSR